MSHNYFTPYVDKVGSTPGTTFVAEKMNAPLEELDAQVKTNTDAIAGKAASAHTHDDRYYTETELSTPNSAASVDFTNIDNVPAFGSGDGDVTGPATNTDGKIPLWDGANSKALKDGLTLTTTVGDPGADTSVPSEKSVRSAIGAAVGALGSGDVVGPGANTADYVPQWSGTNTKTLVDGFPITAAGKALIDDTDAATQRATLGVAEVGVAIGYQSGDKPAATAEVSCILPHGCTFPANLTNSAYFANTGPAAQAVVSIKKNGVEFATATIAIGATAVVTFSGTQSVFAAGDRLSFVFPAQDANWAGVNFMLKGVRS